MKTKSELLDLIQSKHQALAHTLAAISTKQMTTPGVVAAWSVKDTLAHITAWEQRLLGWLTAALRGEIPDLVAPYGMPDDALDTLNQQIYLQHRHRPLAEVLDEFQSSYEQTVAAIAAVPEELLFAAGRYDLPESAVLWEMIAANSYWHYQEHDQDFQTWLASS